MVSYNCPKCNTSFNRKSNYERHLNKKFNCNQDIIEYKKLQSTNIIDNKSINFFPKIFQNFPIFPNTQKNKQIDIQNVDIVQNISQTNTNNNNFFCNHCPKYYSTKGNLTKHLKNCKIKINNDNEKENMFKILLERDKQNKAEINELKGQNKLLMKKLDIL